MSYRTKKKHTDWQDINVRAAIAFGIVMIGLLLGIIALILINKG